MKEWVETANHFPTPDLVADAVYEIACKRCGGREFHVGVGVPGVYLTAVRCVKCAVPDSIHEG